MDKNSKPFDFSLIAQDVESSDGQTRHIFGQAKSAKKNEPVKETAAK